MLTQNTGKINWICIKRERSVIGNHWIGISVWVKWASVYKVIELMNVSVERHAKFNYTCCVDLMRQRIYLFPLIFYDNSFVDFELSRINRPCVNILRDNILLLILKTSAWTLRMSVNDFQVSLFVNVQHSYRFHKIRLQWLKSSHNKAAVVE